MEQLYTIPVNEAFEASAADPACGCPLCALYLKLQENELDLILGASMMEPDTRKRTNAEGFCRRHFGMMFGRKNRLGLALMMESHLAEIRPALDDEGFLSLIQGPGTGTVKKLGKLDESCYVCSRIEMHFSRMLETVLLLWRNEKEFKKKLDAQPLFCLPHYRRMLELAKQTLGKKEYPEFLRAAGDVVRRYADTLSEDVSWFCRKFDYRYQDEPWKNSKDAVERTVRFLSGCDGSTPAAIGWEKAK